MSPLTTRLRRRLTAALAVGALTAGGLATLAAPAQAEPVTTTGSGPTSVTDATFTWGLNGYAQKGIFGPWTFKDLSGNVSELVGSVSGGSQSEYAVGPVPATSMPVSSPQKTPNAIKFSQGVGTIDKATGAGKLAWDGTYTVNAYPAQFNAPDEIYTDPVLTVAPDGSGALTAEFTIGEGVSMENPEEVIPAEEFGRLQVATFDAGSLSNKSDTGYRVNFDYQGVENGLDSQVTTCMTDGGATGWWGSYPQEFIDALSESAAGGSVLPHFYSTSCGGMQDNKPALPADVTFTAAPAPVVTVSETKLSAEGTTEITVTGQNFDHDLAEATRAPICTAGPPAPCAKPGGTYVGFGKFAEAWRPSQGEPSASRVLAPVSSGGQKWALPEAYIEQVGGAAAGAIELAPDGSFTATLTIDKAALDAAATSGSLVNYGIYTYPGSGAVAPAYETYTPVSFPAGSTTSISAAAGKHGVTGSTTVTVASNGSETPTGNVTLTGAGAAQTKAVAANGTVKFALSKTLKAKKYSLKATYAGDANTVGSTATFTYTVAKGKVSSAKLANTKKPTTKKAGSTRVTVKSTGGKVGGKVRVLFTKSGKTYQSSTGKLNSAGNAKVKLPKLNKKGTWSYIIRYYGDANHARSDSVKRSTKIK